MRDITLPILSLATSAFVLANSFGMYRRRRPAVRMLLLAACVAILAAYLAVYVGFEIRVPGGFVAGLLLIIPSGIMYAAAFIVMARARPPA